MPPAARVCASCERVAFSGAVCFSCLCLLTVCIALAFLFGG